MRYKPFLSHKRQRAAAVGRLKTELCTRGAGGWKDSDDLALGGKFKGDIVNAIQNHTGGFLWWGTSDTLGSETICKTEVPTALDRAEADPTYAVVPVFVNLRPDRDRDAIAGAVGRKYADALVARNGIVRRANQPLKELARDAAREYVRRLVRSLPSGPVEVAVTAFREPTEEHDLTLDWRNLFDADTRTPASGACETIVEALRDVREALQSRERTPAVCVEIALPLPLAMLVGYEWRQTTQLRVTVKTVNPGDGSTLLVEPDPPGPLPSCVTARNETRPGRGPFVLAVSVGNSLGLTVDRYAVEQDATGFEHLHIPRNPLSDPLGANEVRALAAHIAKRLNELQSTGQSKHLLLRTPASLATCIGLAANGTGRTWVPFYDGDAYYSGGLSIG